MPTDDMSPLNYSIEHVTRIVRGSLKGVSSGRTGITELVIDSRRLASPARSLFFALVTKRNDGHKYIGELYRMGVTAFVISEETFPVETYPEAAFILVSDTLSAMQELAAFHRRQFSIPVIGVTGSNGKTVVKEWLYQLMGEDRRVLRSPKSYNSQIGVPLSVWQLHGEYDLAVFEAGISEVDEMDRLQAIILPTIGLFTNIGQAHDENFTGTAQKVKEKLRLFTGVDTLFYCKDYPVIHEEITAAGWTGKTRLFTWSRKREATLQIIAVTKYSGHHTSIQGIFGDRRIEIAIPFVDDASVENAIHCWSVMLYLGYENDVIAARMSRLSPIAMRLEMIEGINHCTIINDSYNSDINSLNIALDFVNLQHQQKGKTIILSDILQSGRDEDALYSEIAGLLKQKGIGRIIGIGRGISRQAGKFGIPGNFFDSTEDFLTRYPLNSFQDESILVKGARKFEFEKISRALQQKAHDTVLEINLNALVSNLNYFRSKLSPSTRIMAMVKAFSYGSGSYEIAKVLQFHRVDYLAVAYADEGVELRKAGITLPIMVMNPDEQGLEAILRHRLEPEIYNFRVLGLLENAIRRNGTNGQPVVSIHLKLDTGMHRLGFEEDDLPGLMQKLNKNESLRISSVFSHLAASEDPLEDEFSRQQIGRFMEMSRSIKASLPYHIFLHILNSAGISRFPEAQFDMVRLGISLYGIATFAGDEDALQNVSTLRTIISQIKHIPAGQTIGYNRKWKPERDSVIAVLPIGYADGLNRRLSNGRGRLLVQGRFVPIIGNICMDMCMVDITGIPAREGDSVIIFGKQHPIQELAREMETIPYEILTSISRRVKRIYYFE
jgi:alanine racemase